MKFHSLKGREGGRKRIEKMDTQNHEQTVRYPRTWSKVKRESLSSSSFPSLSSAPLFPTRGRNRRGRRREGAAMEEGEGQEEDEEEEEAAACMGGLDVRDKRGKTSTRVGRADEAKQRWGRRRGRWRKMVVNTTKGCWARPVCIEERSVCVSVNVSM